ncbi:deoxyribonuclease [Ignatzschineria ureiclastica]|uniref:Deoxyribonuclease n=1 Tax=Ignatzschineria ureiclastica TaxID=472582 RepID=A0A2U2AEJ6_9GAMM|nr:pyrimidine dimer DNA glycosylase/endonuclease V [Ignatzschineria ureiclastica]PWD81085.1 deoxyribonuclease [Ignatzschineria ureiclastica]GGZ96114.1 pyrimidine dimer DNA glycosylase/endonuclease V [Ignatzschineria ureiclastica]
MTRINIIPPEELCDQHLLAEHRELTRIPNDIAKRQGKVPLSNAPGYHLGTGHVTFFRDKLRFLKDRYDALHQECLKRGFNVLYKWPDEVAEYLHLWNDYKVTAQDRAINMARIIERMPEKPRYTPHQTDRSAIDTSEVEE